MRFDAEAIRAAFKDLGFPPGTAMIHAGAALVLHGLQDSARDVDIVTNTRGWQHALTLGAPQPARLDEHIEPRPGIEVFSGWLDEDVDGLFARSHSDSGVLYASAADILAFKRRLNRLKDQEHIRILESFLQ